MALKSDALEFCWPDTPYGLSARRIWEHAELGQVNVFCKAIDSALEPDDVAGFIDVIQAGEDAFQLSGLTLADLRRGLVPFGDITDDFPFPADAATGAATVAFEREVAAFLELCSARKAARNQEHPFLPPARSGDLFAVPFVFSALQRQLLLMTRARANADQWRRTLDNVQKKGVRAEELERSNLIAELAALETEGAQATAEDLTRLCRFDELRLSVIPVMTDARRQLQFASTPPKWLRRTKKLPKAQVGQARAAIRFDPILGYRIEQVEHPSLWGTDQHWQAVAPDGQVIKWASGLNLLATMDAAAELAAAHAKMHYPKRMALGRWGEHAWTGGESYREWLITLPYFPATYYSSHFRVRNVLAHVRCDARCYDPRCFRLAIPRYLRAN